MKELTDKQRRFLLKVLSRFRCEYIRGYRTMNSTIPLKYSEEQRGWYIGVFIVAMEEVLDNNEYSNRMSNLLNVISNLYSNIECGQIEFKK